MPMDYSKRKFGTKVCEWCGKEFEAKMGTQKICKNKHYANCPDCGVEIEVKDDYCTFKKIGARRCNACRRKHGSERQKNYSDEKKLEIKNKIKSTLLENHGVDNAMKSKDIQAKARATNLERYGVEYTSQNEDVKAKSRQTQFEHHGDYAFVAKSEQVNETMLERYGVTNPMHNDELKQRVRETNIERYGSASPQASPEVQAKSKATMMEKYGVEHALQNPELLAKAKANTFNRDDALRSSLRKGADIDAYRDFVKDPRMYILQKYSDSPTYYQIADDIGVHYNAIIKHVHDAGCNELLSFTLTTMEAEVAEYIHSLDDTIRIHPHNHSILPNRHEIDLYLPDYSIGIECNATYTHNSTVGMWAEAQPKPKDYHQQKSIAAQENGVFLFHVFGHEWTHKRTIIESMIANLLGKSQRKVYARNTYVAQITHDECVQFLSDNHRQGGIPTKYRLGLKVKGTHELVSLMTFGGMRATIGHESGSKDVYELSRFCSLLNTTVIGGASKLFNHFIANHQFTKVVSFSDIAHTRGKLYSSLGFKEVSRSDPGYGWVDVLSDEYLNRVAAQKRRLPKMFNEPELDIENQTEAQIMSDRGFVQVFDSGVIRWEYTNVH